MNSIQLQNYLKLLHFQQQVAEPRLLIQFYCDNIEAFARERISFVLAFGINSYLIIAIPIMDNNCGRLFLDCQGLWDFSGQIFNCLSTVTLFGFAIRNCLRLMSAGIDPELEDTRLRKLRINIMCGIFLLFLLAEITYSFSAFLLNYDFKEDELKSSSKSASTGYKIVEIICINVLNGLIIYVGQHYWGAVRTYLLKRSQTLQNRNIKHYLYRDPVKMKRFFALMYTATAVCVLVSALLLVYGHGEDGNEDYTAENIVNFVVTLLSIMVFLLARLNCYYVIQKNQEISSKQLRKEFFYASMVFLTCSLRITSYWLAILNIDPSHTLRDYDYNGRKDCYDSQPWHALYIIGLTLFVNLLPAIIFIDIFKAATRKEQISEGFKTTLTEADYSSQN